MMPTYTLIVDGVPISYSAETAPSIGDLVTLEQEGAVVRMLRSSDGGRIYVAEAASSDDTP